ncbi:hypothetical protein K503DRAFT_857097 [Rhizopogon vinicolor AM-OR11-026]|uniref:Uncharacterized protein n=1 Tax=Rhizopogon vinicolor AM-OR11-026 TaxID=1314800 RepID=A0A1B7MZ65_9AGAM|nr:hypothetical protein K503DRAFT_857097 [Rhizopogon vinicolor AM-OR11-026]
MQSPLLMKSPLLVRSPPLPHPSQPVQMQLEGVYIQPSMDVPTVAPYYMTSFTSTPSSIDTIQASANFPPEDTCLLHTHVSYSKQPIPELVKNDHGNWTLTLNVPIPEDMVHPTLTSFSYTIKYSTANHHWASAVQSHILLAVRGSEAIPEGISADSGESGITVAQRTFGDTATMRLSSVLGIKESDAQGQWNHFMDSQQIPFNVRIVESSRLYLQLQVSEYPTAVMLRALSVDVSATWLDDQEGRRLIQELNEAEMRADDAEAQAAAEEVARKVAEAQQAADEQAKETAEANQRAAETQSAADERARKIAEDEAKKASSERQAADANAERHRVAKESAETTAKNCRLAREDADRNYQIKCQERAAADRKAETEKHAREDAERRLAAKAPKAVDQAKLKKVLDNLPADRRCSAGYAWVKEAGGYRCEAGGHYITWEELHSA